MVKQKSRIIEKKNVAIFGCVIALALKVVCLGCGLQPSVQTQAGWLCLETLSATPLLARPGQLVPITGCCGRWMTLEWLHTASGWPEGRLLPCVNHCHQKCLSHREGDTSWPGRALELSAAAAASPCACYMPASEHGPAVHLSPVRHTAGEPESAHQHEHAYTCLQGSLPTSHSRHRARCLFR